MWFLYLLSWIGIVIQISFVILSVAAGLYYIAEIVEEYTVFTCRIIRILILVTMAIHGGLFLFEDLPASMIICGIVSQVMQLLVLRTFPFFELASLPFIGSIVFVTINHYLAFQHFSYVYYPFSQVLAYFTICLWLVPFSFFVSLSANENVLPTLAETRPLNADESDVVTNYFSRRSKRYGLLSFFNYAKESILPQRVKKAF
ncbi:protein TEX261 [Trichonephila inaurata madagascariensis]|uniref:Protein TEX261 n=1 Tax=Trichonephila inaurata madagascariensis TaxID=2747483 RepID=A0A8X6M717_9ARAC|nr:protein TEX261 [Trichonephila inaurata madagascariensis]